MVTATESLQLPCDITADRGICLFKGQKVIVPDAAPQVPHSARQKKERTYRELSVRPQNLIGRWTFDDGRGIDSSPGQHHGYGALQQRPSLSVSHLACVRSAAQTIPGPGRDGRGASAVFESAESFFEVPENADFSSLSSSFSLTMWIYLTTPLTKATAEEGSVARVPQARVRACV